MKTGSKEVLTDVFLGEKVLIKLFIKYNTAIPSSAAVECYSRDISRVKTATLSDASFERLMLMSGNQHHVEVMDRERAGAKLVLKLSLLILLNILSSFMQNFIS